MCGFAFVRSPWSFVSALQEKLLVLESYLLFPSLSLLPFLKGIKSLFALIMGASRDISLRPGGVGGADCLRLGSKPPGGDVTPGFSSTGRVGLV